MLDKLHDQNYHQQLFVLDCMDLKFYSNSFQLSWTFKLHDRYSERMPFAAKDGISNLINHYSKECM